MPPPDPTLTKEQNDWRATYAKLTPEQRAKVGRPYPLTAAEQSRIKALGVIFNVRRALTLHDALDLETYTYRVFFDLRSRVLFDGAQDPVHFKASELARYGGSIPRPEAIAPTVTLEFHLKNDASLQSLAITGLENKDTVKVWTGIRHDPFIFPPFSMTNVVAMVAIIPLNCFPDGQLDFLAWGTTSQGSQQIDHVGRSLRTQNPRLDILNPLPPSQHVAAVKEAIAHPTLMTDLALKFKIQNLFQYRPWDLVPDVMIYSMRFNVGYPNGRRINDDVAGLLAVNGDTLLFELSYLGDTWRRVTPNSKPFLTDFPYLSEPNNIDMAPPDYVISTRNKIIIALILLAGLVVLVFAVYGLVHFIRSRWGHKHAA